MIVAMVCLVLASTLLGTLLRMAWIGRTQAKIEAAALQAEWLAESGLERAAAKLADDANYAGETWNVAAEDLDTRHAGQVEIQVAPSQQSGQKSIQVTAQYPAGQTPSATRSKRIEVNIKAAATKKIEQDQSPASAEKPAR